MAPHELQFIISSAPSSSSSKGGSSLRTAARSHAARSAHARARRLRTIEYQAQKGRDRNRPRDVAHEVEPSQLMGCGPRTALSYHRRDPFMACAKQLKPFEQMLFDHYVTVIIPLMRCNTFDPHFYRRMMGIWVPLALSEAGLLDILLLAASRHLIECDQSRQEHFSLLAFQYKVGIVQALREAISAETPHFTDSTVIKAIMLAYDELWDHDEVTMKRHVEGAIKMVTLKGGPQTLGMDGLVERLLFNLLTKVNQHIGLTVKSPWDPRIASVELPRQNLLYQDRISIY